MNCSGKSTEPLLAGEGGVPAPARHEDDPYRTLDELMAVVEVLCPVWPRRGTFVDGGKMLL